MGLEWLIQHLEVALRNMESEAPVELQDDVAPVELQDDVAPVGAQQDDVAPMEVQPEDLGIDDSEPQAPRAKGKGKMVNRAASRSATFTFNRLCRPQSAG